MAERTSSRIIQRDPIHLWYPHELLFPQPLRLKSCLPSILIAVVIGILLSVLLNVFYDSEDLGIRSGSMILITMTSPAFLGLFIWLCRHCLWRLRAARRDYLLCTGCGHSIDGQAIETRCRGCDQELNSDQARWAWKRALGKPTTAVPPGSPPGTKPVGAINPAPPLATRNRFINLYGILVIGAMLGDDLITLLLEALSVPGNLIQIWDRFSIWVGLMFFMIIIMIFVHWQLRWRKRAKANDYLLCLCCGYTLEGLPEEGTCPECGIEYCGQDCRMVWEKFCTRTHTPRPKTSARKMDVDQVE